MTDILKYIIESSIIISVFYIIYQSMLKGEKCFLFNRYYLILTPIIAFSLPLLQFNISALTVDSTNISTVYLKGIESISNTTANTFEFWSSWNMIYTLYILTSIALSIVFIKKLLKIRRLKINAEVENHSSYNIISTAYSNLTFTFLNNIYISKNESISSEILDHEKVHAKELHSLDILFFEILTILFWFNPIIILLKSASSLNHEFIADAKSSSISNTQSYINALANYQLNNIGLSLGSHFGKPSILKRIQMINKQNTKTMRIKFIIPVIAMFAMFTLFCCEDKLVSSEFAEAHDIPEFIEIEDSPLSAYEKNLDGVKNEIFDIVEEPASPIGGMAEFYKYVGETMKYPKKARKLGIEGRVFVQFIVDKTGQLKDVKSIKGIGAGCDDEAVRVIKAAANWTAGKQRGTPVNVRLILPITFKLTE